MQNEATRGSTTTESRQLPFLNSLLEFSLRRKVIDREKLETSWAGTFYSKVFCGIDEEILVDLCSEGPSRPNVPAGVLVTLEILKSSFGWKWVRWN